MRARRFDSAIPRFGRCLRTTLALAISFAVGSTQALSAQDLAVVDAKIYPSPRARALEHGTVLIQNGLIAAVGPRDQVRVPESMPVVDGTGKVVVAGFWNSHVHFTEPVWANAATAPADALQKHMRAMLTRWGFTTVFDIASNPSDTFALRQRVEGGEVPGPRIYTTGAPLYPENGIPAYVPKETAKLIERFQADSPETATRLATEMISLGTDGIKVFSGAIIVENGQYGVRPMSTEVIRAAVKVAHAAGKPVFAHPSNRIGADHALAGGVDVLAHTLSLESSFSEEELREMKQNHVALIPTLSLFPDEVRKTGGGPAVQEEVLQHCIEQLRAYFKRGGTILFGTDVGYTQLYDTTSEYEYMGRSGMTWRDILASLTTNPVQFFKAANTGEVRKGEAGDLVVLDADPAADVRNFARVAYTIRRGAIIYAAQSSSHQ